MHDVIIMGVVLEEASAAARCCRGGQRPEGRRIVHGVQRRLRPGGAPRQTPFELPLCLQVKAKNALVYQRLRVLTQDPERRFYVFSNEHHHEAFVQAEEGETPNDRNDRAIRAAALWYQTHLPGRRIVLVSNDTDNRRKAIEAGLSAVSAREFAESRAAEFLELADLVARHR